jgi:hypothetical protein
MLPQWMSGNRRTTRAPVNPLDKSTVFSIFPREIDEVKHTIQPGRFIIPPGTHDRPSWLVVGPSSWWKDVDIKQPLLEIPISSIQIAESIVKDWCNGLLACDMGNARPGVFYVPGSFSPDVAKIQFKDKFEEAEEKQKKWYEILVRMADALWARSNGNPMTISDDMKLAARELGLTNKDWLKDHYTLQMIKCKACQTLVNEMVIVCPNCKVILRPEDFNRMNLACAK